MDFGGMPWTQNLANPGAALPTLYRPLVRSAAALKLPPETVVPRAMAMHAVARHRCGWLAGYFAPATLCDLKVNVPNVLPINLLGGGARAVVLFRQDEQPQLWPCLHPLKPDHLLVALLNVGVDGPCEAQRRSQKEVDHFGHITIIYHACAEVGCRGRTPQPLADWDNWHSKVAQPRRASEQVVCKRRFKHIHVIVDEECTLKWRRHKGAEFVV